MIVLTNTLTRQKEPLSVTGNKVRFYSCGPTVYGLIHIGNLRGALVADLLVRMFHLNGLDVEYVRNFTDVDDKIIGQARVEGVTSEAIAERYTREVQLDYERFGLIQPTYSPTVTGSMDAIITMIAELIQKGHAYQSGADVYFSLKTAPRYGALSHRYANDAQSRLEDVAKKQDDADFVLWKGSKPGEPFWASPFGEGRPGWHIECSAMIRQYLGEEIDVHHGGEDLIFPHHENEIVQSECATGRPLSRFWVHHGFVTMQDEKMSKSLGNVITARAWYEQYGAELGRYFLIQSHYRSIVSLTQDKVESARQGLRRMYEAKRSALAASGTGIAFRVESVRAAMMEALNQDLNIPAFFSLFFGAIREWNTHAEHASREDGEALLSLFAFVTEATGIGALEPDALEDAAAALLAARLEARQQRDFAEADRLRDALLKLGVHVIDQKDGTQRWEKV